MITAKKNAPYYLSFPVINSATPDKYKSGVTPVDTALYKVGAGAWTAFSLADVASEIGTTGVYEIDLTAAELNYDRVIIKFAATGMADDAYQFDLSAKLVDDLQDLSTTQSRTQADDALTAYAPNTVVPDAAGVAPTAIEITADIDANSTNLNSILTNLASVDTVVNNNATALAAAAAINTLARLSELDAGTAGKMANQVDVIQTDTTTDIPALLAGLNDLNASEIRTAIGLVLANLDTQLSNINSKTTNLPIDPASETNVNANEVKLDAIITTVDSIQGDVTLLKAATVEKNTAGAILILMLDSSGNPITSTAVTGLRKIDTGAFAAMGATISNTDAYGYCHVAYTASDVNGVNTVAFRLSATGANDSHLTLQLT